MIGNDIVDLALARQESNWQRKGWLDKIFTLHERQRILTAPDPHPMVWLLWSMKESAYKIAVRAGGKRCFAPAKLECQITELDGNETEGTVSYEGKQYLTKSSCTPQYIATVSVPKNVFRDCSTALLPNVVNLRKFPPMGCVLTAHTHLEERSVRTQTLGKGKNVFQDCCTALLPNVVNLRKFPPMGYVLTAHTHLEERSVRTQTLGKGKNVFQDCCTAFLPVEAGPVQAGGRFDSFSSSEEHNHLHLPLSSYYSFFDPVIVSLPVATHLQQREYLWKRIRQQSAAALCVSEEEIQFHKDETGAPWLTLPTAERVPLSVSHHGRFGAFVFLVHDLHATHC